MPAIDLKDGNCVRLLQGRAEDATVYSDNPVDTAKKWKAAGAEILHIVDLDGAFSGTQKNLDSIRAIRRSVDMTLEVGGGIRTMETIDLLISMGIERVILGTVAAKDPGFLRQACDRHPGKVIAGIDAKDGKVAIKGWVETTGQEATGLAQKMKEAGAAGIIYTDISRDGMLTGPNFEATERMARSVDLPVIASGGISSIDDIRRLLKIEGLWGAITGKAIYTGRLDVAEAVRLAKKPG
ncbi:MAG: 1-(5-phosphoribosyl)-5-[(5-phosphoribosylamino)methylideneamino]imidazole-4-carboxamide isomerase [Nitrospiraceae bacterium]|nr:1-(5-phosphoribosyl)-5-[(5-phosphoribosylamino)methylideneamino]imidazole-4-carboxamide isomerase [Nitrospiraceae bacterium]MDA8089638.1 1-(5-phosphoribosyl)-5-[(5-phosphoribosylamino)methylideneamino]imidazole-4-carboxamide isomerase [Nitrospiraceae bacterium]